MVVAPAWTATVIILRRNSGSVRVPSSVENSTSSTKVRARRTDSAAWSSACSRVILSLCFEMKVGGGEEDVDAVAGGGFDGAGGGFDVLALAAGEGGDAGAFDLAGDGADGVRSRPRRRWRSRLRGCRRRGSASWWAMRSFSSWCMVQPGDCSPSRRVVSKKTIWFGSRT